MTLLIIGAGGHGKVVAETAEACGYQISFLDDNSPEAVGTLSEIEKLAPQYDAVFVAIGHNETRKAITDRVGECITLIHPTAYVSPSATIGPGTFIAPHAAVNANVIISRGCIVSLGAIVDHDAVIGDYTHIDAGVVCKSRSRVRNL